MMRRIILLIATLMVVSPEVVFADPPFPTSYKPESAFISGHFKAVGRSAPNQDEYSALRAAKMSAQRELLETIKGVRVSAEAESLKGLLTSDVIKTAVEGLLQGSTICENGEYYDESKRMGYVCIEVGRKEMLGQLYSNQTMMDKIAATVKPTRQFTPQEVKPAVENYDGLIIDLKAHNFRPALINKIFSAKNDVLYDPSKISRQVLVENGCGDYTNSVDKAKAALEARGVSHPLIIKAIGVVSATDAKVSEDDAVKLFSANQNAGFFSDAKVAFVLK